MRGGPASSPEGEPPAVQQECSEAARQLNLVSDIRCSSSFAAICKGVMSKHTLFAAVLQEGSR